MIPAPLRTAGLWLSVAVYLVLPLVGLFAWGWDWRPIVLLYWLENITIGGVVFISLVRRARGGEGVQAGFPAAFFLMHYGLFTFVHGVFVIVGITLIPIMTDTPGAPFNPWWVLLAWLLTTAVQWVLALRVVPPRPGGIGSAYGRVIVLHVVILGAVWLIAAFGLPSTVAVALVVLHAVVDVIELVVGSRMASGRYRWEQTSPGRFALRRIPEGEGGPSDRVAG
ncbi:DUF6498-containing protein [Protaetiibacter intestinalis]|uniref:Uncharacterized protein n=1 Tax=Protaetiibacter intestinalis TaxID=2419774 RepID=A0A387B8H2_9MICO|nr:DUF6498-containing protein [Protaetiibacter intestinalis]AYF98058.1 hypothetical protein D7I47_07190 [Protaetiibacter intestinalis]